MFFPRTEGHGRQDDGEQKEDRDVEIPARREHAIGVLFDLDEERSTPAAPMTTNIMIEPSENRIFAIRGMSVFLYSFGLRGQNSDYRQQSG